MTREASEVVGGFADIPLLEDVALSRHLRPLGTSGCISGRVMSSRRRWERHGVWRTIRLMRWLRRCYFLGADSQQLALEYRYVPRQ